MVPEIDQDNFVEPESPQTVAAAQQRGLSAQESGQKENLATDAQRRSKSEMVSHSNSEIVRGSNYSAPIL